MTKKIFSITLLMCLLAPTIAFAQSTPSPIDRPFNWLLDTLTGQLAVTILGCAIALAGVGLLAGMGNRGALIGVMVGGAILLGVPYFVTNVF